MTDNIIWAMRKMVTETSWMDDESKNATLRKLATTKTYLGYPDNYSSILNHLFENVRRLKLCFWQERVEEIQIKLMIFISHRPTSNCLIKPL